MAEILAPGETGHEIPASRPDAETQRDRHHAEDIAAAEKPRHARQHEYGKTRGKPIGRKHAHWRAQKEVRFPKMPDGRRTRAVNTAATETICDHSIETSNAMTVSE